MNKETYLARFKEITDQMYDITYRKNHDYTGDDAQPFKNFTMIETMGVASTAQGFLTRMMDKMMRIGSFVRQGTLLVKNESVKDTLLDLAIYCILFICYLESTENACKEIETEVP